MNGSQHVSLGAQVSKKMSSWILILVAAITVSVFLVSFFQSRQMFLKQVNSWSTVIPQQAITSLIDSDHFSIQREVSFLQSTGLFSTVYIADNQKNPIAYFGKDRISTDNLIPIKDEAKVVWGYYFLKTDFNNFFAPFFISGISFLGLALALYFFIRWRVKSNLAAEFLQFNQFLTEIEKLTESIHEIYNEENPITTNKNKFYNIEQIIINKAVTKLLEEIKKANKSVREAISASEQQRFQDELTTTALQVVHDIGSPLATLEAIVQSASSSLPEDSRISLRNAALKMRDIANSLLKKAKKDLLSVDEGNLSQQLLHSVIYQVVTEKRLQYKGDSNIQIYYDFNQASYKLFATIRIGDLSRIISNIINNSVESFHLNTGEILVSLSDIESYAVIEIKDNGRGIPEQFLSRIGEYGLTFGKENGNGLGLFHAKTTIENWSGKLEVLSTVGLGTIVRIYLPKTIAPSWFVPELKVSKNDTIVIIDDDETIHDVWRTRLSDQCNLVHLYSPIELTEWQKTERNINNFLYLCDYEFIGHAMNGIDMISQLNLNFCSILVTSRWYINHIIDECETLGLKLLPKEMAGVIPISILS